jgi:hypothetical protein
MVGSGSVPLATDLDPEPGGPKTLAKSYFYIKNITSAADEFSYGMPGVGGRGQKITGKISSLVPAINVIMI